MCCTVICTYSHDPTSALDILISRDKYGTAKANGTQNKSKQAERKARQQEKRVGERFTCTNVTTIMNLLSSQVHYQCNRVAMGYLQSEPEI